MIQSKLAGVNHQQTLERCDKTVDGANGIK